MSASRRPLFYFRADSSARIGTGHIYRCLSLAEALRTLGAEIVFLCRDLPGNLSDKIRARGFRCELFPACSEDAPFPWQEDAALTLKAIDEGSTALIVDHYSLDLKWEEQVAKRAPRLLVIDDLADRRHHCTWLLDGGFVPDAERRYENLVSKSTSFLLGPAYALIRPEFRARRQKLARSFRKASEILVYFGSGDRTGSTLRLLGSLAGLRDAGVAVKLLVSDQDPQREQILASAAGLPFVTVLDTNQDMSSALAEADIFVGSGGMINWERACLSLPSVVATIADNQVPSSAHLGETGHILYLGPAENVSGAAFLYSLRLLLESEKIRETLGRSSARLVDGCGASRVAKLLVGEPVTLRRATNEDRDLILDWRNHEFARKNSMNPAPIARETHYQWFERAASDPNFAVLMAENEGKAVGVLRLERKETSTLVSIFLDPNWHRRGFGPAILAAGSNWVRKHWPEVTRLEAHIKDGNLPSITAFKRAGYRKGWSAYLSDL